MRSPMAALFDAFCRTARAACYGFWPEDWLPLASQAGSRATVDAPQIGSLVLKSVLARGPIAGVVKAARGARPKEGLRDRL